MLELANGHLLFEVVLNSIEISACFLVHRHELYLSFHHCNYFIDLVDLILGKTALSIVEVSAPDVSQEVVTAVLSLNWRRRRRLWSLLRTTDFLPTAFQLYFGCHAFKL